MDKPNFKPLLDKLRMIVSAEFSPNDLKEIIPAHLKEALSLAEGLHLPDNLKKEASEQGAEQLQIIFDDVTEFNAKQESDEETTAAVLEWVKTDVEKAFGFYENVERQLSK